MIKRFFLFFVFALSLFWGKTVFSQTTTQNKVSQVVHPSVIRRAHDFKIVGPIRDLPPSPKISEEERERMEEIKEEHEKNVPSRADYHVVHTKPPVVDPVWQRTMGKTRAYNNKTRGDDNDPIITFDGQIASNEDNSSRYFPSDVNGSIGKTYFMQMVNTTYAIYERDSTLVTGPHNVNTLFNGVDGADENDGDPIVLWDDKAERWLAVEFSISGSQDYMLIAVSKTDDPTGEWYAWSFEMDDMPDYPHFGIWRDGYYMGINDDDSKDVFVFEREAMLNGESDPQMIGFDNPNRPNSGFHCIMPLDNDGDFAPSDEPGQFVTINDDAWGNSVNGGDELWVFELKADWDDPSNSTFERTQAITVADFDSDMGSGMDNVEQSGTSKKLDAIPQILMFRAQYRNFGNGDERIVCAHTVDVDDSDHGGIRWYELYRDGGEWKIRQQGTYAPDEHSRFQPSIAEDINHNIAIGYTVSSSSMHPSIRYAGQSAAENADATGELDIAEHSVYEGTQSQGNTNRWGDYCEMSVDPRDGLTFWFTSEYYHEDDGGNDTKFTKITCFKFEHDNPINLQAKAVSTSEIDVSWKKDNNGDDVMLAYSDDGTFGTPTDGQDYNPGDAISGGGTVIYVGADTTFDHTGLDCSTKYYYKAWSKKSDGSYSSGVTTNATTWDDTITVQPHDTSACEGDDITLSITVVGEDLTYQWQKDDADIDGATSSTYTLHNVSSSDEANYRCVVRGSCGDVTSDEAKFTIADPTEITTQPTESTVCESESATLAVSATGSNLSYQWRKDGENISGATSSTLSFADVTPADRGIYSCVVTGGCGMDTSDAVALYVKDTVVLLYEDFESVTNGDTIPPEGWTRDQGTEGSSDEAYGWEFGDADNVGSSNFPVTDHTLFAASNDDKHTSTAMWSTTHNDAGSDFLITPSMNFSGLDNVTLTFETFFMEQNGSKAYIRVSTDGGSTWDKVDSVASEEAWVTKTVDLSAYAGQTDVMVAFHHNDQGDDALGYAVDNVLISGCQTCAHDVTINTQPENQEACEGADVTFSVDASGSDLLYRWTKDGEDVDAANDASLVITSVTQDDEGDYRCVVANGCGYTVNSDIAGLIVNEPIEITANPEDQNLSEGSDAHFGVQVTGTVSSYQWMKDGEDLSDGGNISGSTTDSLTISSATSADKGYYKVRITGPCNELTSDSALLDIATDIQKLNAIGVNMYPNPASTNLTITAENITYIKVVDMTGRVVIEQEVTTQNKVTVDFSQLPAGTYVVYGNYAKGQFKAKIIKKK